MENTYVLILLLWVGILFILGSSTVIIGSIEAVSKKNKGKIFPDHPIRDLFRVITLGYVFISAFIAGVITIFYVIINFAK